MALDPTVTCDRSDHDHGSLMAAGRCAAREALAEVLPATAPSEWDQPVTLTLTKGQLVDLFRFVDDERAGRPDDPEVPVDVLPALDAAIAGAVA